MNHSKYQKELGETAACTKIMMEATQGLVQKYRKRAMKDCFIFDSWFSSNKLEGAAMEVGAELIGMANKNTKGFYRETIDKLTKDRPGGSHLVLRSKPIVPGGRPLIATG